MFSMNVEQEIEDNLEGYNFVFHQVIKIMKIQAVPYVYNSIVLIKIIAFQIYGSVSMGTLLILMQNSRRFE